MSRQFDDISEDIRKLNFREQLKIFQFTRECLSSNDELGKVVKSLFAKIFEDLKESDLENISYSVDLFETMDEVLATLTPLEEKVIKGRFALFIEWPYTQRLVGIDLNYSQQRISQIEAKALRKLRHPSRSRRIKAFLEGK